MHANIKINCICTCSYKYTYMYMYLCEYGLANRCVHVYVCLHCMCVTYGQHFNNSGVWLRYLEPEYHKCNSEKCETRTE